MDYKMMMSQIAGFLRLGYISVDEVVKDIEKYLPQVYEEILKRAPQIYEGRRDTGFDSEID